MSVRSARSEIVPVSCVMRGRHVPSVFIGRRRRGRHITASVFVVMTELYLYPV